MVIALHDALAVFTAARMHVAAVRATVKELRWSHQGRTCLAALAVGRSMSNLISTLLYEQGASLVHALNKT